MKLLSLCLCFFSFFAYGESYISGKVLIQDRLEQPVAQMRPFPMATIESQGAHSRQSDVTTGVFTLVFSSKAPSSRAFINLQEASLQLNGKNFEIVNINNLSAITRTKENNEQVLIIVCPKGMRRVFEQQLATSLFKKLLNGSPQDTELQSLIYKTTSLLLSNKYSKAESLNNNLLKEINAGNYKSAKNVLKPAMEQSFEYLEREKSSGLEHKLLHNESVKSIISYIHACLLTLTNKEAIVIAEKLYKLERVNATVILFYGGYLRYLEQYDAAKTTYGLGQLASLKPKEKAMMNLDFGRLYAILDEEDSARYWYTQMIAELERYPIKDLDVWAQIRDLNYHTAMILPLDIAKPYYYRSLATSNAMLSIQGIPANRELIKDGESDSGSIYRIMSGYYLDLQLDDSAAWTLEMARVFFIRNNVNGRYDESIEKLKILNQDIDKESNVSIVREEEVEKMLSEMGELGNDYERAKLLLQLGHVYFKQKEFISARSYYTDALVLFEKVEKDDLPFRKLRVYKADAYNYIAATILYASQYSELDSAIWYKQKALSELSMTQHQIRESYSKEISENGEQVLEWMNLRRAGHQGLMATDEELSSKKTAS